MTIFYMLRLFLQIRVLINSIHTPVRRYTYILTRSTLLSSVQPPIIACVVSAFVNLIMPISANLPCIYSLALPFLQNVNYTTRKIRSQKSLLHILRFEIFNYLCVCLEKRQHESNHDKNKSGIRNIERKNQMYMRIFCCC